MSKDYDYDLALTEPFTAATWSQLLEGATLQGWSLLTDEQGAAIIQDGDQNRRVAMPVHHAGRYLANLSVGTVTLQRPSGEMARLMVIHDPDEVSLTLSVPVSQLPLREDYQPGKPLRDTFDLQSYDALIAAFEQQLALRRVAEGSAP
ncbi:MAG: hypothetical protein H7338_00135 [Candidatus Sericytochromatia bacterium]|nr:hypothetical protein [Candidatus Sericytochromatia bacterium]